MSENSLFSDILETAKITNTSPQNTPKIFKENFIKPKDDLIDILAKKDQILCKKTDSDVAPQKSILKTPKNNSPKNTKKSSKAEDDPMGLFTRGSTVYLLRDRQITKEVIKINYQKRRKTKKASTFHAKNKKPEVKTSF